MWDRLSEQIYLNFIKDDRWQYFTNGLEVTLIIAFFAALLGIVIGLVVGVIRSTHEKTHKLKFLNFLCSIYLTVIRGTPVVVQLMIIYYIILANARNKIPVAILAFGINSGAYVAEIFRSGIMSIDNGQMEAGRSLGFNYIQTMWYVVMPQAFKNVLPALCNEFIALQDLTKAGDIVRSRTFDPFFPLLTVAAIYLVCVIVLTQGVKILERRLRQSEH